MYLFVRLNICKEFFPSPPESVLKPSKTDTGMLQAHYCAKQIGSMVYINMCPPQNEQIALSWNTCVEQTFHGRETRSRHSGFIIHHHSSSFIIIHHVMSAKRDQSYDQWYNLQETLFDYDFIKRTHSGINFSRLIHLLP